MNICPSCKKPSGFKKNRMEKIFCSNACKAQDKKNGIMKPCIICNKPIYVKDYEKTKKYCSRDCKHKGQSLIPRKKTGLFFECPRCKNKQYCTKSSFELNKTGIKYCSIRCKSEDMKEGKVDWCFKNEGKNKDRNIYPRKQINNVRMKEHRRIIQEHIGRKLHRSEHVHHINGNPLDNRIENLQIVSAQEHGKIHKKKKVTD